MQMVEWGRFELCICVGRTAWGLSLSLSANGNATDGFLFLCVCVYISWNNDDSSAEIEWDKEWIDY